MKHLEHKDLYVELESLRTEIKNWLDLVEQNNDAATKVQVKNYKNTLATITKTLSESQAVGTSSIDLKDFEKMLDDLTKRFEQESQKIESFIENNQINSLFNQQLS